MKLLEFFAASGVRWTYAAVLHIIYTKENDADCVHPIRVNVTHRGGRNPLGECDQEGLEKKHEYKTVAGSGYKCQEDQNRKYLGAR